MTDWLTDWRMNVSSLVSQISSFLYISTFGFTSKDAKNKNQIKGLGFTLEEQECWRVSYRGQNKQKIIKSSAKLSTYYSAVE